MLAFESSGNLVPKFAIKLGAVSVMLSQYLFDVNPDQT